MEKEKMRGVERRRRIEQFSPGYYGICTLGGMISTGATHFASTPLDCLKVHMHVCSSLSLSLGKVYVFLGSLREC